MNRAEPGKNQVDAIPPNTPQKSWLKSVLAYHPWLFSRLVTLYRRVQTLSRHQRRRIAQRTAASITGAALIFALTRSPAGATNTINVVNGEVADVKNGKCSLIEAIINARAVGTGNMRDDCAAGNPSGPDTINLPTNGNFVLTAVHNDTYEATGLPVIKETITINGNGSTIQRSDDVPDFRILAIAPTGTLTLNSTTIKNGYFFEYYYEDYGGIGGAGILNKGHLTITNSNIAENRSLGEWGNYYGGGISNEGTLIIEGSTIQHNSSRGFFPTYGTGGGIYNAPNATLTLRNSVVTGNSASGYYSSGGGIKNRGNLIVVDSVISDNTVWSVYYSVGGGINNRGNATISGSLITNNEVEAYEYGNYGGGIFNGYNGVLNISNSTISGNISKEEDYERYYHGGGGLANYSQAQIVNSTIANNNGGGVITTCRFEPAVTRFRRTIVSGNIGYEVNVDADGDFCTNQVIVNNFNVFGKSGDAGVNFPLGDSDIVPVVGLNSIIGPLGNNGGPTQTHALPPGSPAIDRAPNNQCNTAPVNGVDQRGSPRNSDGDNNPSSNECDIGAFERQGNNPTLTATPTATNTNTPVSPPTSTPIPTETATPKPTHTPKPTRTPKVTPTTEATHTPTVQASHTPGPSPTPTMTQPATETPSFTATPTVTQAAATVTPTPPLAADYSMFVPLTLGE